MYLSALVVNAGENPDRPNWNIARRWLNKPYRVHQRLCMAFPSATRKQEDPEFLRPHCPKDFSAQVEVRRGEEAGFLYRVEADRPGRPLVLVQSAIEPDWDYAFHNADYLLAESRVKQFEPAFCQDQMLRFRLQANPTKKLSRKAEGKRQGRRVGLYDPEEQRAWLDRKGAQGGFRVVSCEVLTDGRAHLSKPGSGQDHKAPLLSVRFEGALRVADPDTLLETLRQGIGSAKAFGFGLLSVAPAT